jgi:beta-galactosidase
MLILSSKEITKILLLSLILFQLLPAFPSAKLEAASKSNRIVISMNTHWKFHKETKGQMDDFKDLTFNDSNWENICLPHTWNAEDGTDGGNNYYRGNGWYRKKLFIPEKFHGKSLLLQFDAANKEAEVYINGKSVFIHKGGYTAFTVDITNDATIGKINLIAVRVNNERNDEIPLNGDFTFYGGLYRGVKLLVTDQTHIDVENDGSNGVYVHIPNNESIKKNANIAVSVPVKISRTEQKKKLTVLVSLKDAKGKNITSAELKPEELSKGRVRFTGSLQVKQPHLWNGSKDPYLYFVETEIVTEGKILDKVTRKVGFRYYSIDPNKGFFLNGKKVPLHGVAIHQDRQAYGSAVPDDLRRNDFQLMDEMGVNALRTAHYPHSQFVYDQADERGWIVWTEIPFVNEMSETAKFADNTEQQVIEMIKQNYNHPSIIAWGLQNELGAFGGYIPRSKLSIDEQFHQATNLMQRLVKKAKKLDPERMTAQAIMGMPKIKELPLTPQVVQQLDWSSNQGGKHKNKVIKFIDIPSLNFYFGWYTPTISDLNTALTNIHKNYPDALIGLSEYGAGANPSQHQQIKPRFKWNTKKAFGQWHPEEYQSYFHEASYTILEKHPELWAAFIWNMFDFGSDGRNEGGQPGVNDKGLVSFDRKLKKDAFYFYKSQWNKTDPFVYITSRRFTKRTQKITTVKVYSNQKKVVLMVNGKDYGIGNQFHPGVFVWDKVGLQEGLNNLKALARKADGTNITDQVTDWKILSHP